MILIARTVIYRRTCVLSVANDSGFWSLSLWSCLLKRFDYFLEIINNHKYGW